MNNKIHMEFIEIQEKNAKNMTVFASRLLALKSEAIKNISIQDYRHLKKIIWTNRLFYIVGYGTAWIIPNPLSMLCISFAVTGQWTMVAHHVCHGGYNRVPGIPRRYTSDHFAMGWRRLIDWPDMLYPPAWKYEHNTLHHFYTNESLDPDVPARRIRSYINPRWPIWFRYLFMFINVCAWKITYYSTNILKAFKEKKNYNNQGPSTYYKQAIIYSYIPYTLLHFAALPLLFYPLGWSAVLFVAINRLGAEIITNIHTFLTIVPNHAGDDIPLQTKHFTSKEEFFLAQIASAGNYNTGGFWRDYMQGYLNYQIEHHLFSDLPLLQYVKLQPKIKALCKEFGVPYKQESIFIRIKKTFQQLILFQ